MTIIIWVDKPHKIDTLFQDAQPTRCHNNFTHKIHKHAKKIVFGSPCCWFIGNDINVSGEEANGQGFSCGAKILAICKDHVDRSFD